MSEKRCEACGVTGIGLKEWPQYGRCLCRKCGGTGRVEGKEEADERN